MVLRQSLLWHIISVLFNAKVGIFYQSYALLFSFYSHHKT